jgi:hypothetical protein
MVVGFGVAEGLLVLFAVAIVDGGWGLVGEYFLCCFELEMVSIRFVVSVWFGPKKELDSRIWCCRPIRSGIRC